MSGYYRKRPQTLMQGYTIYVTLRYLRKYSCKTMQGYDRILVQGNFRKVLQVILQGTLKIGFARFRMNM